MFSLTPCPTLNLSQGRTAVLYSRLSLRLRHRPAMFSSAPDTSTSDAVCDGASSDAEADLSGSSEHDRCLLFAATAKQRRCIAETSRCIFGLRDTHT